MSFAGNTPARIAKIQAVHAEMSSLIDGHLPTLTSPQKKLVNYAMFSCPSPEAYINYVEVKDPFANEEGLTLRLGSSSRGVKMHAEHFLRADGRMSLRGTWARRDESGLVYPEPELVDDQNRPRPVVAATGLGADFVDNFSFYLRALKETVPTITPSPRELSGK